MLVMVDGIDGSGKGTIVGCLSTLFQAEGRTVVNAKEKMRTEKRVPGRELWPAAEIVITAEPTYILAGAAIREELVRDPAYSPRSVAHAFAVDREIHYRRVVLPALSEGKIVLSERGIASSLAYQVTQGVPEEELLDLPGNALALAHAPEILIIAMLPPETAIERLRTRAEKNDDSYFERLPFLQALSKRYTDEHFRRIFTSRGTRIVELSTEGSLEDTKRRCKEELMPLLSEHS